MNASENEDQLTPLVLFSWLISIIISAYLSVHGPDFVVNGFLRLTDHLQHPFLKEDPVVQTMCWLSGAFIVITSAVLFSGYLLYGFAPPAEGSRAGTYAAAFALCSSCALIFPFCAWIWGGVWETRKAAWAFPWLAWALYVRCSINSTAALQRPYVLFFRRFDSFADLSILPNLLRLSPRNVPVVALTQVTDTQIGYWDPLKLMTYGLRATIPWGGRPIFLNGGTNWENVMESLVDRSAVVVLDQTEKSDAMSKELRTVVNSGRPLILLCEANAKPEGTVEADIEIPYEQARGALVIRLTLFLILAAIIYLAELPRQLLDKTAEGDLAGGLFGAAIMLGLAAGLSSALLLRRDLNSHTKRKLAKALRVNLNKSAL